MSYTISETVEGGIERIVYTPSEPRFATPIVFQHGMWHGAWCWRPWQERLAELGWESHAHSLPGHGRSPVQRPIRWCTLQYYYEFLNAEILRQERPPVLVGHSMGGALCHWWLRYGRSLPAIVMVAPWAHDSMEYVPTYSSTIDPLGQLLCLLTLSATPAVRTPDLAFRWFLTEGALLSAAELHARLGPESGLVLLQYTPRFGWRPASQAHSPTLIVGAEADLAIPVHYQRAAAAHYGCDYTEVPGAGHDLMLERSSMTTVEQLHAWLAERVT
jgi:pimeloyl-ACP methyl ester carboxylesterase